LVLRIILESFGYWEPPSSSAKVDPKVFAKDRLEFLHLAVIGGQEGDIVDMIFSLSDEIAQEYPSLLCTAIVGDKWLASGDVTGGVKAHLKPVSERLGIDDSVPESNLWG
jgi:hypothetical protein